MKLKKDLNGVLIISVPGIRPFATNYIRSIYNKLFTYDEKKNFEFITLDYESPFSLSVKTLSIFYNYSKVHLNTHPKERHGRAQTYALSSGLPIVGMSNLCFLVEKNFRKKPYYYVSKNYYDMPEKLIEAVKYFDERYDVSMHELLGKNFRSKNSFELLQKKLISKYDLDNNDWFFNDDWDIRLAKSHVGYKTNNSYNQPIQKFLSRLDDLNKKDFINEDLDDIKFTKNETFFEKKIRYFKYQFKNNSDLFKSFVKAKIKSLINNFKIVFFYNYAISSIKIFKDIFF